MHFIFFKEFFDNQKVISLCWTLFHSLWQGLIFAFIAGVIIIVTRRSKPPLRYNVLSVLFAAFVGISMITFLHEQQKVAPTRVHQVSVYNASTIKVDYTQTGSIVNSHEKISPVQLLNNFLSQHAYLIVAIWFFILCAKTVKIIFTLLFTRHLIKYKSHVPSTDWIKEFTLLCHQLKMSRTVTLLESEIIKLPVVFGHLKPVIFIPLGLLSHLSPEQAEAILIHELAHIRRNDYLVNLLQNMVEVLFFFNPGILWISSLIREERENCCDDIAIAQTNNRKKYVEALVSFKQLSLYNHSKTAVAFSGSTNSFINRVKRIIQNKNYTLSSFEKGSLLSSGIIAMLLLLAFTHPIQNSGMKSVRSPYKTSKDIANISVAAGLKTTNNIPVSVQKFDKRHADVEPERNEKKSAKTSEGFTLSKDSLPDTAYPAPSSFEDALKGMRQVISDLVREKVVSDTSAVLSFSLTDSVLVVNDQRQSESLHQMLKTKYGIHANYGWYYGPVKMTGTGLFIESADVMRSERVLLKGSKSPEPPSRFEMLKEHQLELASKLPRMIENIVDDLISLHVVTDRNSLRSFNLTNSFLVVNGKIQPDDLQEKLRERYLTNLPDLVDHRLISDPNFGVHYNRLSGAMGIGISINKDNPDDSSLTLNTGIFPSRGAKYFMEHYLMPGKKNLLHNQYEVNFWKKFLAAVETSQNVIQLNELIYAIALQNKTSDSEVTDDEIGMAVQAKKNEYLRKKIAISAKPII